ncbi:hypothetical protein LJB98_06285 [Bacteroidales bacterium OttesenSCG-928-M11]|nr:hypothetical protein [Bacteroidales bacterium OttesenSCG-928-M11]
MRVFLLLICLLFSLSCASQKKEVISKSTIKLEGENTNIRDFIEIGGYYAVPDYQLDGGLILFEDGTCAAVSFKEAVSEDEIKKNLLKNIVSWKKNEQFRWGSYWGVYQVKNDTIVVYGYDKGSFWKGWSLSEERYKIINRTTIKKIFWKSILKSAEKYYERNSPWVDGFDYHFFPADSLPPSDCWLKEEKWIWRNEKGWKEYMERIKQKKKR